MTNFNSEDQKNQEETKKNLPENIHCEGRKKLFNSLGSGKKEGKKSRKKTENPKDKDVLDDIERGIVEEFNKKHAVIHIEQFFVLTEKEDPITGGYNFTLESRQSFLNLYENHFVELPSGKKIQAARLWLQSAGRRKYDGILFHPAPNAEISESHFNIFRGFSVSPSSTGSCEKFKEHMRAIICGGNEKYFLFLWKWCARLMQSPHLLAECAIVLKGSQGTGKNTFVDAIGAILGVHYAPLDNIDQILGRFTFHLRYAILIHGNESLWGGDKRSLGRLKAMITERFRTIEGKGKDAIVLPNFTHLILSSNEAWPVHLDRDDRRFLVLEVSEDRKEDREYFAQIAEELKNGGYEALLHELQEEDISNFDPRAIPKNTESFGIKLESAPLTEKYIYEVLLEGGFDIGAAGQNQGWERAFGIYEIPRAVVYNDYANWCSYQKIRPESESRLGKAIKKLIPSTSEKRGPRDEGRRRIYEFQELGRARKEFEKSYKIDDSGKIW